MASTALYLKWRPQQFQDVVGQEHVTQTLQNALRGGRIAHAYLFTGPRGTGKTSMARLLAKAVNCLDEDVDALEVFAAVIDAQGGDPRVIEDGSLLDRAPHSHVLRADRGGSVHRCDAYAIGIASVRLGGGRERKEDDVDAGVGITLHAKRGDEVAPGDALATITYRDEERLAAAMPHLQRAWDIHDRPTEDRPLILDEVR